MDNYHLLSVDEESETQKLSNFPRNVQLASGEAGMELGLPDCVLVLPPSMTPSQTAPGMDSSSTT